jgi:hypothetical protein
MLDRLAGLAQQQSGVLRGRSHEAGGTPEEIADAMPGVRLRE